MSEGARRRLQVEATAGGQRVDHYLSAALPEYSRSRLQAWIGAGRVTVNGAAVKASAVLRGGEEIWVEPAAAAPLRAFAEDLPVAMLYEDASVVVVNKPAGMVVHMGAGNHAGTLVNALLHRFGELSGAGGEERPGIVHRIDRETSGVLVVARNDQAHRALSEQFAGRTVEKEYLALVHGVVKLESGRIEKPIARDPNNRLRMTSRLESGRAAISEYKVLKRFERCTYVSVRILTGRTHQIRVHMSSIGHPLVGDKLYGAPPRVPGIPQMDRFFLHSHSLTFVSPATGGRICVEAPLPEDLERALAGL
ncbi:MAG: RluA family pseudouridine synthase [Acidobacteriota bacterium]